MDVRDIIFKEFVKNGHAKSGSNRAWNIANRSHLHLTPELSKGFLKLQEFEPYKKNVFDVELKLIKDNSPKFIEEIGTEQPFNLIDIGCGSGEKAKEFIRALKGKGKVRYCPVSPDDFLINEAIKNVKKGKFKNVVKYEPHKTNYDDLESVAPIMRNREFRKNVILLHGSILASYEINDFLFSLGKGMFEGCHLIIGNGIRTGERLVGIEKYRNKMFDGWFMLLMKEIGFKKTDVEYDARFGNGRIEVFYRLKKNKKIKHKDKELEFKEGDEIMVAVLYKYYLKELDKFFKMYFKKVEIVKDKDDEYILALCKK